MAIISITNFGGEIPRLPARALPAGAAQVNLNLLATATEFRPLQDDITVGTAPAGTKTLYRLSKDGAGVVRTSDVAGWIAEAADKNYVKGQVNDDGTERTYISFNDGTQKPRAIDALGQDRLMGVPSPFFTAATLVQGNAFTLSDATAWADSTLVPSLYGIALAHLPLASAGSNQLTGRVSGSPPTPTAGAYGLYGMTQNAVNPWLAERTLSLSSATASGLDDPTLSPSISGSVLAIQVVCLPYWAAVADTTGLATSLRAIEAPNGGAQLFSDTRISAMIASFVAHFDPADEGLKTLRSALDVQVKGVNSAIDFVLASPPVAPTVPTKPTVPEYDSEEARNAQWVAYDTALVAYNAATESYSAAKTDRAKAVVGKVAAIAAAKADAEKLTQQIEQMYNDRRDGLQSWIRTLTDANRLVKTDANPDGLVTVDADRIVESRFYIATHVNDWGEESAPSAPSAMLDVDQYATVTIDLATPPTDRNLVGWRIYRTANASNGAPFLAVTDDDPVKVVLSDGRFDYFRISNLTYQDAVKGVELGEACPTVTWLEPPYRMQSGSALQPIPAKGSDPYLRGLVGMPNGVMAGYIDNFVAFCDPYHPYAWPAEYRISLKYQIVGLGVFGQSLFVGTAANPSIISGSDSASMSEQLLDDAQACLSARSIVSMDGGVLYASPDGICFANGNGVQVISIGLFAREDWQALNPSSIVAAAYEGVYYFAYTGNYNGTTGGCLALDTIAKKLNRVDINPTALFTDQLTDALFYTQGTAIKRAFSTGRRIGRWKSGKIVFAAHAPLAWLQVDGDQSSGNPVTVRWYGDGVLCYTATVNNITPVRLPAGRWREHEVEIETSARLTHVILAGSTLELQKL